MTQVCLVGFQHGLVNYVLVFCNIRSFDAIFTKIALGNSLVVREYWCRGPRFGRFQIRLNAYPACARKRSSAFICADVMLETYVTPEPSFHNTVTAHVFLLKKLRIPIILEYLMYY